MRIFMDCLIGLFIAFWLLAMSIIIIGALLTLWGCDTSAKEPWVASPTPTQEETYMMNEKQGNWEKLCTYRNGVEDGCTYTYTKVVDTPACKCPSYPLRGPQYCECD